MNPIPCSVCSESGHHARRCPQLYAPLQPGFFAPSGGGGHSHDDEDEKLKNVVCLGLINHNGVHRISSLLQRSATPLQTSTSSPRV